MVVLRLFHWNEDWTSNVSTPRTVSLPSPVGSLQKTHEEHWVDLSQCSADPLPILQEQYHVIMSRSLAVHRCSVSNALNIVYYIKLSTGTRWLSTPGRTESPFSSLLKKKRRNVVKELCWLEKAMQRTELKLQILQSEQGRMKWCLTCKRYKTFWWARNKWRNLRETIGRRNAFVSSLDRCKRKEAWKMFSCCFSYFYFWDSTMLYSERQEVQQLQLHKGSWKMDSFFLHHSQGSGFIHPCLVRVPCCCLGGDLFLQKNNIQGTSQRKLLVRLCHAHFLSNHN